MQRCKDIDFFNFFFLKVEHRFHYGKKIFANCGCTCTTATYFARCEVSKHLFPSGLYLSLDVLSFHRRDPLLRVSAGSLGSYVTADLSSFKTVTAVAQPWVEMSPGLQEMLPPWLKKSCISIKSDNIFDVYFRFLGYLNYAGEEKNYNSNIPLMLLNCILSCHLRTGDTGLWKH